MTNYARRVWGLRYFWGSLAASDLRSRYRGSQLGFAWSLAQPVAMCVVLSATFKILFGWDLAVMAPLLFSGLAIWTFFSSCVLEGCEAFLVNEAYIRQVRTPLAIYTLRTTLTATVHLVTMTACAVAVNVAFNGPTVAGGLLAIPCVVPVLFLCGWAAATAAAVSHVFFRDTKHVAEIAMQLLFQTSAVIYPAAIFRERGVGFLIDYNPVAALIDVLRRPLLAAGPASAAAWGTAALAIATLVVFAAWLMGRCERKIVFRL